MFWLERTPLWIIGLVILVVLLAAEELGYGARRLTFRKAGGDSSSEGLGYLLTGALALLGLLIAFTFSAASDRYDTRRHLVVEEANAIGTTYLRIQALDETPRAALSALMVRYGHVRLAFYDAGEDAARLQRSRADTDDLQNQIWAETVAVVRANPTATINPGLQQTTNDMFDLAASRRAAMDARLPISILRALLAFALISAGIIGYGMARERRLVVVSAALFLALSVAICLILDLDRPRSGTVTISQAPMIEAIASMESAEAAKTAAAPSRSSP
jgi:hypothetical protein